MVQKDGPVNSQLPIGLGFPDDTGEIAANPPPTRATLFLDLIEAKDALILAHFRHPDIGLEMDPEIGYSYPR